jgi:phage baseplate assembly protein W
MTTRARTIPRPIGWPLLPLPDAEGRLRYPTLEESVRQMIQVILLTRPGEQLMRPEFGAGLDRFLHETNTADTRRRICEVVAAAIAKWETRLLLDSVVVDEVPGRPTHVRVDVTYRLRRTGAPQSVGMTMELGG